jgi:hypothetical protein
VIQPTPPPRRRQWMDPCIQSGNIMRNRGRRRRRDLTHPATDLFSLLMWNFDVMTILCRDSELLSLCTFVVTNLADLGLLTLCTFLAMTGAMNLCVEVIYL